MWTNVEVLWHSFENNLKTSAQATVVYDEFEKYTFNSSPPSAADMRPWTGSALFQIMACRLFGAKPLCEPVLGYCQWDQTSVEFQ